MNQNTFLAAIAVMALSFTACESDHSIRDEVSPKVTNDQPVKLFGMNTQTGSTGVYEIQRDDHRNTEVVTRTANVSANGHYSFFVTDYNDIVYNDIVVTYTFSAMENSSGVHGHINVNGFYEGFLDFQMDAVCITAEGNRATVGGIITQVNDDAGLPIYFQVGNTIYLAVEDNGEGANAPSDKVASAIYIGFPELGLLCDVLPPNSEAWLVFGPWEDTDLPSDEIQVND